MPGFFIVLIITAMYKAGIAAGSLFLGLVGYYILFRLGSLAIFKSKSDVDLATNRKLLNRILEKSKQERKVDSK